MEIGDDEPAPLEPKRLKQLLGYVLGALVRRRWLALLLFVLGVGASLAILKTLPRSYHVDTKILAQKQQALPMLSRYATEEPPTYVAAEIIRRRDNLRSIVEKTKLVERWNFPPTTPPLTQEDKLNALAGMLSGALSVTTGEGTLTIAIDWPDGETAAQLVEATLQSFLDSRRLAELSSIEEAIAMLEARAGQARSEIETMEVNAAKSKAAGKEKRPRSRLGRFDPAASQLKAMLDARKRVIRETEDFRQRRLEELQIQLAEKQAVYGETYPSVVALKKEIESFSREPQRLVALRAEERDLETAYRSRSPGSESSEGDDLTNRLYDAYDSTDEVDLQRRFERVRYQSLLERIESTKIDLEAARSIFKYRYSVIWPAQNPGAPNRPNVQTGLLLGFAAALLLAALGATLADLRAKRFVAAWQLEQILDLPIIAEVRRL